MTKIYYACRDLYNAGDYIGPYLFKQITGREAKWSDAFHQRHLIIAGSVLQHATSNSIVLGAGFGTAEQTFIGKPKLLIVRGPLTEQVLLARGFEKTWALGDPGLFLPFVYQPPTKVKKYKLGVIPHYIDKPLVDPKVYHVIDIQQPIEPLINAIVECETIISSSLHGVIMAHAYGVPARWVEFSDEVVGGGFKFRDYYASVAAELVDYGPVDCRNGIPADIWVPPYVPSINKFRGAFGVLKRAVRDYR